MKYKVIPFFVALMALCTTLKAQFAQSTDNRQFMMKIEVGALPFVGNFGTAGDHGFYLANYENGVGANFIAGMNLSQDFFVGAGLGYDYLANIHSLGDGGHAVSVFADADFRPIWMSTMGQDYIPKTVRFAPMVGARAGVNAYLGPEEHYGTTITWMAELYAGVNWHYKHRIVNMERNHRSIYAHLGVALMQQTVFFPVRIGWRW